MKENYLHLNLPRRGRFYFAFGVGLMFWYMLRHDHAPPAVILGLCFFLAALIWLCFRHTPAGMEIRGGQWRFFVGQRQWTVQLRDLAAVQAMGSRERPRSIRLLFRDGRSDVLPPELAPRLDPLERELELRGIPLETRA